MLLWFLTIDAMSKPAAAAGASSSPPTPPPSPSSPRSPPPSPAPGHEEGSVAAGGSPQQVQVDEREFVVDVELGRPEEESPSTLITPTAETSSPPTSPPCSPTKPAAPPPVWHEEEQDECDFIDVEMGLGKQSPSTLMKPTAATTSTGARRFLRGALVFAAGLSVLAIICGTGYLFWLCYMIVKDVLSLIHS